MSREPRECAPARTPPRPSTRAPALLLGTVVLAMHAIEGCKGSSGQGDGGDPGGGAPVVTASAGWDRLVASGWVVTLDGSKSSSSGGERLTYQWAHLSGPPVTLSDATAARPTFTAPAVEGTGRMVFGLTVDNGRGGTATSTVSVQVLPSLGPDPTTSPGLIDRALQRGLIDPETALLYRVYATFGDASLPAQFRSAERGNGDSSAIREAVESYPALSPSAQALLAPYLLPPSEPGSWYARGPGGSPLKAPTATPALSFVDTANGKARVWWPTGFAGGEAKARGVAAEIDGVIWPALADLMQTEPLSDAGLPGDGGSGRLDVYLVDRIGDFGATRPFRGCRKTPAYVVADIRRPLGSSLADGIIQTVVHELMHAWQFTCDLAAPCRDYDWLADATATWAEDHVYPSADGEHQYAPWYLDTIYLPLELPIRDGKRSYGEYLLFQYLTRAVFGPSFVREVWEKAALLDSRGAVDEAHPAPFPFDGVTTQVFPNFWGDFLEAAWNASGEGDGWFQREDHMSAVPVVAGGKVLSIDGERVEPMMREGETVLHLSGAIRHLYFPDPSVRSVVFLDGLRYAVSAPVSDDTAPGGAGSRELVVSSDLENPRGVTRLVAKIDGSWRPVPFVGTATFCRDKAGERVEELAILFGNGSPTGDIAAPGLAPVLLASNIGCRRWRGTASSTTTGPCTIEERANVTFERRDPGLGDLQVATLAVNATVGGTDGPCTCSGSGSWSFDADAGGPDPFDVGHLGFAFNAIAGPLYRSYGGTSGPGPPSASYTVSCPDGADDPRHGTFSLSLSDWFWTFDELSPNDLPHVGPGGTSMSGTATWGNTTYSWSFTSEADP